MNLTSGKKQKSKSFLARFAGSGEKEYDANLDVGRGLQHEEDMEAPLPRGQLPILLGGA